MELFDQQTEQENKPDYLGHRERIKNKYGQNGFCGWQDYEVLELVLTFCIPRKDTKPIAKELVKRFKTFAGVLDASPQQLMDVNGIGKNAATFLKVLKDSSAHYLKAHAVSKDYISDPQVFTDYIRSFLKGQRNETVMAVFLDKQNAVLKTGVLQSGTVDKAVVFPRQVVEQALEHKAVNVILAHNHPAGACKPSQADLDVTDRIASALKTVEISLLDHIIISENAYFSFNDHNLI